MTKYLAIGALALLSFTSAAQADPGFYGDLRGGAAMVDNMFSADRLTDLAINPRTGWSLQGGVGYRFDAPLRVELQAGYQHSNVRATYRELVQVTIPCGTVPAQPCLDPNVTGSVKGPSVFAMGYYDLPLGDRLTLSLGAGVGAQRVDVELRTIARMNSGTSSQFSIVDAGDTVFAGRGAAELAYNVGPVDLTVGYSFTRTGKATLPVKGAYIPTSSFSDNLSTHQITGGVRFTF